MLQHVLILTPFIAMVYGVSLVLQCPSKLANVMFFFACGLLLNLFLKLAGSMMLPAHIALRPLTCPKLSLKNNGCEQCGMIPSIAGPLHGTDAMGMPSGHVQFLVMIYVYAMLALPHASSALHALAMIVVAVSIQRVSSGCHTWFQVVAGAIIGSLLGLAAYCRLN